MRHPDRDRREPEAGFTLVEVMIALAILALGLAMLLRTTAANVFAAQRAQVQTAATSLARAKMYDLEETLLVDGFQEMDKTEEGDFSEEGWPQIAWKAEIIKIELPDMATLQDVSGGEGAEGAEAGAAPEAGGGMLGGMLGTGGAAGAAGMMGAYYSMVTDVLTEAIRKVTLTITYKVANETETLVVTCYFTDPSAVNRKIPFAGGGGGEEEGGGEAPPPDPNSPTPTPSGRTPTPTGTPTPTPRGGGGGER